MYSYDCESSACSHDPGHGITKRCKSVKVQMSILQDNEGNHVFRMVDMYMRSSLIRNRKSRFLSLRWEDNLTISVKYVPGGMFVYLYGNAIRLPIFLWTGVGVSPA